jgi:hypothetical protein
VTAVFANFFVGRDAELARAKQLAAVREAELARAKQLAAVREEVVALCDNIGGNPKYKSGKTLPS